MAETVGELGELGVLRRVLARLSAAEAARLGPGDDCAVLGFAGDAVVTTDTMIEGADFRLDWHGGFELGWKLAATNLSDVAAMGAAPIGLTVALACPAETPVALLEEIARGLDAACRELAPGCGVVGGDLARSPALTAAVTALGELRGRAPVTRSGARTGDVAAYAGQLGLAGVGLGLLFEHAAARRGEPVETLAELRARRPAAIGAQLAPRPPVQLGVAAALAGASAMLDVSDGLALDAARIGRASSEAAGPVALDLDPAALEAAFGEQEGERVPLEAMLFGGEDHGLLATFPAGAAPPEGFRVVGEVRAGGDDGGDPGSAVRLAGAPIEPRGWDPFAAPEA